MSTQADVEALAAALRRVDAQGHFALELDAGGVLCLVGTVQLANRHPVGRHSWGVRRAADLARKLCARAAERDPEFGRFLERGWHAAFDLEAEGGEGGAE